MSVLFTGRTCCSFALNYLPSDKAYDTLLEIMTLLATLFKKSKPNHFIEGSL
jgi:hypothetical protein